MEMGLSRRALIALIGGAAAAPSVGVKTAASALGLETALVPAPEPYGEGNLLKSGNWWSSPLHLSMEARRQARRDILHGAPYPHMKSWGYGFRQMVVERDHKIMAMYEHRMKDDESFREKVFAIMGLVND